MSFVSHRAQLFLASLLVLLATAARPALAKDRSPRLSPAETTELGGRLASELAQRLSLVEDARTRLLLDQLSERLLAAHRLPLESLSFHLVEDPARDAFTIPGRHVYLTTGMVRDIGSEAEWTAMLNHQLAHVVHQHSLERLQASHGGTVLRDIIGGERQETLAGLAANVASAGLMARNSLRAEREADETAAAFPGDGGGQDGLLSFLSKLRDERHRPSAATKNYLHRHEVTQTRLKAAKQPRLAADGGDSLLPQLRAHLGRSPPQH